MYKSTNLKLGCLKLTYQKNQLEVNKNYLKKELTSKRSLDKGYSKYLFGMEMPGRTYNNDNYRFSFNGMEKDKNWTNTNSHLDFGARIYDSRLGKFLSKDPLLKDYPYYSPYQFAGNSPIVAIDKDGEHIFVIHYNSNDNGSELKITSIDVIFTKSKEHIFYLFDGKSPSQPYSVTSTQVAATAEYGGVDLSASQEVAFAKAYRLASKIINDRLAVYNNNDDLVTLKNFPKPVLTKSEILKNAGTAPYIFALVTEINPVAKISTAISQDETLLSSDKLTPADRVLRGVSGATSLFGPGANMAQSLVDELIDEHIENPAVKTVLHIFTLITNVSTSIFSADNAGDAANVIGTIVSGEEHIINEED